MIAELLVRTFTVILLRRRTGGGHPAARKANQVGVVHAGTQLVWGDGALLATGEVTGTGVTDIDQRSVHPPEGGHGAAADRHRGPAHRGRDRARGVTPRRHTAFEAPDPVRVTPWTPSSCSPAPPSAAPPPHPTTASTPASVGSVGSCRRRPPPSTGPGP